MADSRLYVHVLLDRSGSMESCRDKTIDAFNEYIGSLRHQSRAGTRLSLTTFDSESTDLVFNTMRIDEVPKLTRDTFVPRGSTPLYDSIAATVAVTDKVTLLTDERVTFAIRNRGKTPGEVLPDCDSQAGATCDSVAAWPNHLASSMGLASKS